MHEFTDIYDAHAGATWQPHHVITVLGLHGFGPEDDDFLDIWSTYSTDGSIAAEHVLAWLGY